MSAKRTLKPEMSTQSLLGAKAVTTLYFMIKFHLNFIMTLSLSSSKAVETLLTLYIQLVFFFGTISLKRGSI